MGVLLFLGVSVVSAGTCNATVLWNLCSGSALCAKLFQHDQAAGIQRALDYFSIVDTAGRGVSTFPTSWAVFGNVFQDCSGASAQSISSVGTPSAVQLQLSALLVWRGFLASGLAVLDPHAQVSYDPVTDQYYTGCADGHSCASSTSDSSLDAGTVLVIVTSVGLIVVILAVFAYLIWRVQKMWKLLLAMQDESPHPPPALSLLSSATSVELLPLSHFI